MNISCTICGSSLHETTPRLKIEASIGSERCDFTACSFCIRRVNGMTRAERTLLSKMILKLPSVEELEHGNSQ